MLYLAENFWLLRMFPDLKNYIYGLVFLLYICLYKEIGVWRATFSKIVCEFACQTFKDLNLSLPIFHLINHYHYTVLDRKHQILPKLGAFYNNLPKMHSIYVIWAPLSLMKPTNW